MTRSATGWSPTKVSSPAWSRTATFYNLCVDFDDEGGPTPRGIAQAQSFIDRARNWTPLGWRLYWLGQSVAVAKAVITCDVFGHQWVDDSHGGPDSGCMAAHCTRCGDSFHHTLY